MQYTSRAPNIIVVNCDRSPHSAKNVIVNDCKNIRDIKDSIESFFACLRETPASAS